MKKGFLFFVMIFLLCIQSCSQEPGNNLASDIDILTQSCSQEPADKPITDADRVDVTESITDVDSDRFDSTSKKEENEINFNASGGTDICCIHEIDFHEYSIELINSYVGEERFRLWHDKAEKIKAEEGCRYPEGNLYKFIHYFDIPKEIIIELYNSSYQDICVDLIYEEDEEAVDLYYRLPIDEERKENQEKWKQFYYTKGKFVIKNWDMFSTIPDWGRNTHVFEYSLIELCSMTGIPFSDCAAFMAEVKNNSLSHIHHFDYDAEYFLSKSDDEIGGLIAAHTPYYLDSIFCGLEPYDSRYERQVAENRGK